MKNKKIIILYVLVIFVLGLTAYLVYSINSKANSVNTNNNADENMVNSVTTNKLNVVVSENVVETVEPELETEPEPEISSETIDNETIKKIEEEKKKEQSKKDKAIDLVKKAWGKDDSVYFYIDEENGNGKYVVSVRDKDTTSVIEWYDVDTINNTAKIQ